MTTDVITVKAFQDNYLWLVINNKSGISFTVDPGDAQPIIAALEGRGLGLDAILVTHHHPDHIGGVDTLVDRYGCPVYGPDSANIPQVTVKLKQGDRLSIADCDFQVLEVPGHTLDHIAYFSDSPAIGPALFCGDTLFAGGCGRVFEGTPSQMSNSLQKIASLPPGTRIYCAHEYTLSNLRFALAVEPGNRELAERMEEVNMLRSRDLPSVPSELAVELATNPFLRTGHPAVRQAAAARLNRPPADEVETFAAIRGWKDNF